METIPSRVGFVATRFSNQDAIGREAAKWAELLKAAGHECFYFAGASDREQERSVVVPEASCQHPDIAELNADVFDTGSRSSKTSGMIQAIRFHLKQNLYQFIKTFDVNVLIIENAFSMPNNLPLGLALSELVAETNLPAIAHHHELHWWHERFMHSTAEDYLQAAFPPVLPAVWHVVSNSHAARQLAQRANLNSIVIPPALDFEREQGSPAGGAERLQQALGIDAGQPLVLQPTSALPSKRVMLSIEAAASLDPGCVLVVSGVSPLETVDYRGRLLRHARLHGVDLVFADGRLSHSEQDTGGDDPGATIADAYRTARWISYPIHIEELDPAFLQAAYYRRPLLMSRMDFARSELAAQGMQVLTVDESLGTDSLEYNRILLADREETERMSGANFELGRRHYHLQGLAQQLELLLVRCLRGPS
jgi:hypothetical protein